METIKSSQRIGEILREGKRAGTPELSLIALPREDQHDQAGRVAFIAGKKLGNAVWRNHAKRRLRALCQELGGPFPGCDVIFLARKSVGKASFAAMVEHTAKAAGKLGLKHD